MANVGERLYRLQVLDTELSERQSKLRETEALLGESAELRAARRALTKAERDLSECGKHLRNLEMDLKKITARVAKTRERLYGGQVTNPKELAGLEQDFEHSKGVRDELEDSVLGALERHEVCEQAVTSATHELTNVETAWREQQASLLERVEQLKSELADLEKRREGAAAGVDQRLLALYNELRRKKGGRAVALLVGGTCQGCRVSLPSGKVQQARKSSEVVICSNCGCILNVQS